MGIYKVKGSPYYHFAFTLKGVRYRGSTGANKRQDAETIYAAERRKILLGDDCDNVITLEHAFAKYEEEHAMFLKSYEAIQAHVNSLLAYFGNTMLQDIGQNELEKYVAKCRSETYTRGKRHFPISNATINRRIAAFQGLHTKATKSWKMRTRPIDFRALKLKERVVENNTLNRADFQKLYDAAPPHIQRFIMITIFVGWRKANVLSLNGKKQIDLRTKTIKTIGKGGKLLISPISESFEKYIKENGLHKQEAVITYDGLPVKNIKMAWRNLFKRAKLPYIRPHDLRHTFGTWVYESTGDQRLVQELLHHSDIKTSMRYTHTLQDTRRKRLSGAIKISVAEILPKKQMAKKKSR